MKKIIVAIDGFSSCGKSTMAKALARYAGYTYVDTGAMYRAVALYGLRTGIVADTSIDLEALQKALSDDILVSFALQADGTQHTMLNGEDVECQIRSLDVANAASRVSAIGFVRRALVDLQRRMGVDKGIVMDGRDIGTVVFPDAELKVFVTASAEVRAQRRYLELKAKGTEESFESVLANVVERDERDTNREESPLRRADDACLLDNSNLNPDEQLALLCSWFDKAVSE